MRQVKSQPRGYILVVTLGLLVLAATLLVGIGRASMSRALAAQREQADLQRRWGAISCRNAILPAASDILTRQERLQNQPLPVLRTSLVMGGQRYALVISDEQAKANVNTLLERTDKSGAEGRIRDAIAGSGLGNSIFLRPEPLTPRQPQATSQPAEPVGPPLWISGFGQIFNNVAPDRLLAGAAEAPVQKMTCWGSGAVNIMRTSEDALRLATTPLLTNLEIGRLVDARNAAFGPQAGGHLTMPLAGSLPNTANLDAVSRLLTEAKIDPKVRRIVGFTGASTCFSLWIVTQDQQRTGYRLFVSDQSNPNHPRVDAFAW